MYQIIVYLLGNNGILLSDCTQEDFQLFLESMKSDQKYVIWLNEICFVKSYIMAFQLVDVTKSSFTDKHNPDDRHKSESVPLTQVHNYGSKIVNLIQEIS